MSSLYASIYIYIYVYIYMYVYIYKSCSPYIYMHNKYFWAEVYAIWAHGPFGFERANVGFLQPGASRLDRQSARFRV